MRLNVTMRVFRTKATLMLALAFGWAALFAADQRGPVPLEPAEFKASILAKIPPYVEWPAEAFPGQDKQIILGIVGDQSFVHMLEELVKLKNPKGDGRKIVIKTFENPQAVTKCHILFIPEAHEVEWLEFSRTFDGYGTLTVFSSKNFIKTGGVFNLSHEQRLLEIHIKNAKKAGLKINSKLLDIAKVIR